MTLDDAIKHAEEVAYQKDLESGFDTDNERYAMTDSERADCETCADEHRQLAEWLKDYKRLLEQQPSDDCISRQAVLDEAYAYGYGLEPEGYCVDVKDIQALPPVTPTQRWIPVSERLPEKQGDYLCSLYYAVPPYNVFHPEKDIYIHDVSVKKFDGKSFISSVKAWQPLPKPYEEKRGDSDGSIHA